MKYQMKLLSALDKVTPFAPPLERPENYKFTGMRNETLSFQIAYSAKPADEEFRNPQVIVTVDSSISDYIIIRRVNLVPVQTPAKKAYDDDYLTVSPCMLPDLLTDLTERKLKISAGQWHSLWIDIEPDGRLVPPGIHPIKIGFTDESGNEVCSIHTVVEIYDVLLPKQDLIYTQWFHMDCLADYYDIEVFSEQHWDITRNFIETAAKRGINMLLTPVFTPPLDTDVGGERTTVQLVDVFRNGEEYSFDFDKLERWVNICRDAGIEYFEISHLFTQWGAKSAPKIMAEDSGVYKRIFGWETAADSPEYAHFLSRFLPVLADKLKSLGIAGQTFFHISDEPSANNIDSYAAAKNLAIPYLEGFKVIDALSKYEFYSKGLVEKPVVATSHVDEFLMNDVPGLWVYYCTSQSSLVSNRFIAQPSRRNRIIGTQFYKFQIEGMLHWGYNFYNSQFSRFHINPYAVTDAGEAFQSGDAFSVYPGADGMPEESIRLMVFAKALDDLRAFKLLESLTDREFVMQLIEGDLGDPITFSMYPKSDFYLLSLRNRVNREIAAKTAVL